jgi:hypothetical protein
MIKVYNGDKLVKTVTKNTKRKHVHWRETREYRLLVILVKVRDKICRIC